MAQWIKNLPAVQEIQAMWIGSLGREDPLEEGIATQSSVVCLKNPMDRGAWWGYSPRVTKSRT